MIKPDIPKSRPGSKHDIESGFPEWHGINPMRMPAVPGLIDYEWRSDGAEKLLDKGRSQQSMPVYIEQSGAETSEDADPVANSGRSGGKIPRFFAQTRSRVWTSAN
ncbi:hypothetical protein QTL95_07565 [Rhizobium sp. S152]|uniref:hypothetical protein n=1 Tax=Rhizobium sp. S152 TaxID=3055038 RepID=UPI0025AA294A|nr:hypothetical protein [Rhizobium sp. S152]MDM9625748.1 hypothetical protein [Rhizobium sp. S152]